ncbi:hypothetical protein DSO57_1015030 [Entomophthora muscae]|uniref:Uncharacterized protein n=1 Tax=Entomophthora muscae TaxID=34485 RepID=A0ACC2RWI5_9FUNG|nr:hypothetical protein DSO57_1015030 [Entomophthora muscae]
MLIRQGVFAGAWKSKGWIGRKFRSKRYITVHRQKFKVSSNIRTMTNKETKSRVITPEQFSKSALASFRQVSTYAMGANSEQPGDYVDTLVKEAEKLFDTYGQTLFVVPTMILNAKNSIAEKEDMDFTATMKGVAFYGLVIFVTVIAVCLSTAKHAFSPPEEPKGDDE